MSPRRHCVAVGAFCGVMMMVASSASAEQSTVKIPTPSDEYVAHTADCVSCHTNPLRGKPLAGGYGLASPLGVIYSTNITPSRLYGIGGYSEAQFKRALRHQLTMIGNASGDRDQIDIGCPDEVYAAAIRTYYAKRTSSCVGRLSAIGGHRNEFQALKRLDGGDVSLPRPTSRGVRADDSNPNGTRHISVFNMTPRVGGYTMGLA